MMWCMLVYTLHVLYIFMILYIIFIISYRQSVSMSYSVLISKERHVSVAQKEGTLQEVLMFHIDRTDRMHPDRVWYADVYRCMQYTPFKTHPVIILSWLYVSLMSPLLCSKAQCSNHWRESANWPN
jgi:hypothetical protein